MDTLVVTGHLAENAVTKAVKGKADVLVLDIEVAAFITPALLRRHLPEKKYDLILIPGLASGDFTVLENELGTPIRLGPKHAVDLGSVLSFAGTLELSTKIPACEMLAGKMRENAIGKVTMLEEKSEAPLVVKSVKIGGNSRMKVMAEIVDAARLGRQELIDKILYFEHTGADIIDLGMSLGTSGEEAAEAVKTARLATTLPLSIDTLEPALINTALENGVDIVLSLNSTNINDVKDNIIKHAAVAVVIPDRVDDMGSLFQNLESARDAGIQKIIADPVLEPAGHGLVESINRFYEFRKKDKTTPLFFGTGNVTELMDADSIGINALLSAMGMELDASILFTPDFSHKAYNCVFELKTASMMMALAKERNSAPKDLGIDMLAAKEKRRRDFGKIPVSAVIAKAADSWHLDPAGCFRIEITQNEVRNGKMVAGKLMAQHKNGCITGTTAREVLDTIIGSGLVSRLDHAAYLGRELMKAELALKFNRSYSQDDEF
jgi:dihydropteroate synthase-like protein